MPAYYDVTILIFVTSYLCSRLVHVVIDLSDVDLTKYILHWNNFNVQNSFLSPCFFKKKTGQNPSLCVSTSSSLEQCLKLIAVIVFEIS